MSPARTGLLYLWLGYKHILPLGFDHILFVLCLFFFNPTLKGVMWQSLVFTFAHSVTLCLAAYHLISIPSNIIEPLIAVSILYLALENVFLEKLRPSRMIIIFLFGLVHGLGFAGALKNLGLPQQAFLSSLVLFNAGVELGQLTVILLAWFIIGKWYSAKPYYRNAIVKPVSLAIGMFALVLAIQRTGLF